MKAIYAIRDNLAESINDGVYIFANDTVAVRAFGEVASNKQTNVGRYPQDHDLLCLGVVQEAGEVTTHPDGPRVVLTGKQWLAAQEAFAQQQEAAR